VLGAGSLQKPAILALSCAALALTASPAGALQPALESARHTRQVDLAHASCATSSAHSSRRSRGAGRRCHASAHARHTSKLAKPRRAVPTPAPRPTVTATLSAPAQSPSGDAASIAAVLAAPCQNTELTPEAANIALVREAVLCLINRKRAENGESPLAANPELEQAAEGHCQELIADDYFAHVSPSGETPVDRIRATGYIPSPSDGYVIGENLAWGTYQLSTPQSIVSAWIASPGHLANILETQYRDTGIGVTPAVPPSLAGGAPGATYAQEFGIILK
jgi:uncharacterized protein YkwD